MANAGDQQRTVSGSSSSGTSGGSSGNTTHPASSAVPSTPPGGSGTPPPTGVLEQFKQLLKKLIEGKFFPAILTAIRIWKTNASLPVKVVVIIFIFFIVLLAVFPVIRYWSPETIQSLYIRSEIKIIVSDERDNTQSDVEVNFNGNILPDSSSDQRTRENGEAKLTFFLFKFFNLTTEIRGTITIKVDPNKYITPKPEIVTIQVGDNDEEIKISLHPAPRNKPNPPPIRTLVFWTTDENENLVLNTVRQDGVSNQTNLGIPLDNETPPVLSPDGQFVAYVQSQQIWMAEVTENTTPVQLISEKNLYSDLAWSPDGQQIAFRARSADPSNGFLAVVDKEKPYRKLTEEQRSDVQHLAWIDDHHILYDSKPNSGQSSFSVIATDGTGTPSTLPGVFSVPTWSLSGTHILVATTKEREILAGDVNIENIENTVWTPITIPDSPGTTLSYPSYSPDGLYIAFLCNNAEELSFLETNRDRNKKYVTRLGEPNVLWYQWSPDSKYLAYLTGHKPPYRIWYVDVSKDTSHLIAETPVKYLLWK